MVKMNLEIKKIKKMDWFAVTFSAISSCLQIYSKCFIGDKNNSCCENTYCYENTYCVKNESYKLK